MKIALASAPVKNRNIAFNVQSIVDAIEKCGGKTDLILFGESALQGFDSLCWNYEADKHMAVSLMDAPIQRMREAARKHQGIGTRLLHTVELHLREQGKTTAHVHLGGKEYFESRNFYPKHGYVEYAPSMMKKEL